MILLILAGSSQAGGIFTRVENGKTVFYNVGGSHSSSPSAVYYSDRYQNYEDIISEACSQHGVEIDLVKAVIQAESNFNPYAVSPKGARGLMQLMPDTALRYGVRSIFDPRQNIQGGVHYLKDLLLLFNYDLRLAVAAYNAGENRVQKINDVPNFTETQNYVRKVLALYHGDASFTPIQANWRPHSMSYFKLVDAKGVTHYSLEPLPNATKVSFTY